MSLCGSGITRTTTTTFFSASASIISARWAVAAGSIRSSQRKSDGAGGNGPSCGNYGCASGEECRGGGAGDSRSTQGHWLKYSFAISLRPANQTRYLRVVSGGVVSFDRRSGVRRLRRACPYQTWQGETPSNRVQYVPRQNDPEIGTEISRNRRDIRTIEHDRAALTRSRLTAYARVRFAGTTFAVGHVTTPLPPAVQSVLQA